jgi:hypothetical protein
MLGVLRCKSGLMLAARLVVISYFGKHVGEAETYFLGSVP